MKSRLFVLSTALTLATLTALALVARPAAAAPSASKQDMPIRIRPPAPPPVVENPALRKLIRAALATRRAEQVKRLKAYLDLGIFPRNRVSPGVVNIFRDEDGLLCAIASLIHADGLLELVEKTARDNNQVRIGTLKSGPLLEWVLSSGFTQAEVAFIQLPDSPVGRGGQEWFIGENRRIRAHLTAALARLEANTDKSLDAATDRLMSSFTFKM